MDNQQGSSVKEIKRHPRIPAYVSEDGKIYNLKGQLKCQYLHRSGYLRSEVVYEKKRYFIPIHRAVAETFLDPPSDALIEKCSREHHRRVLVLHKDDNRMNNHFTNLKWGTHQENISQAFANGLRRSYEGAGNPSATLTEEMVVDICRSFQDGCSRKEVQERFGLTYNQVYFIHTRRSWKNISSKFDF